MKSGIYLPPFAEFADPRRVARLAAAAEQAGWDGFFIWDHVLAVPGMAVGEAWTTLAAIAAATSTIRLGALVTPLARRRPWTLARQIATLDQLAGGRLVAGIGLGDDGWQEFSAFGEQTDPRARGQLLDESLDVLLGLLAGNELSYHGSWLDIDSPPMLPTPVQDPLPVWAAVRWPNRKPLARAARLQGSFPIFPGSGEPLPPSPAEISAVRTELASLGAARSHDIVIRAVTHRLAGPDRRATVAALAEAGVTWLLEGFAPGQPPEHVEAVVAGGPPGS